MPPLTCSPLHGKRDWLPYTAYHESRNGTGGTHCAPGFCFPGFLIIKLSSHFGKPFNEVRISGIESPFSMPPSHARRCTEKGTGCLIQLIMRDGTDPGVHIVLPVSVSRVFLLSKCPLNDWVDEPLGSGIFPSVRHFSPSSRPFPNIA